MRAASKKPSCFAQTTLGICPKNAIIIRANLIQPPTQCILAVLVAAQPDTNDALASGQRTPIHHSAWVSCRLQVGSQDRADGACERPQQRNPYYQTPHCTVSSSRLTLCSREATKSGLAQQHRQAGIRGFLPRLDRRTTRSTHRARSAISPAAARP